MSSIVVVGAGPIGSGTALALAAQGHEVHLVSRSGGHPGHPKVRAHRIHLPGPGQDPTASVAELSAVADGAQCLVNALNPAYTRWPTDWPPLADALLAAARRSGAGLVTVGNLYAYGQVDGPMREDRALAPNGHKGATRAAMWAQALQAHEAGQLRATELRASDYFGPGAGAASYFGQYILRPALAGKPVRLVMGDPDAPHSWSYLPDLCAAVAALAVAPADAPTWGRPWHAPTSPARSLREVLADAAELTGMPPACLGRLAGRSVLRRVVPMLRELDETAHQFERPFVLDSSRTETVLGLAPTPWRQALGATISSLGGRLLTAAA